MKTIEKIAVIITVFVLLAVTACAEEYITDNEDINSDVNDIITDYSAMPVKVIQQSGDTETVIYTGPLGGYDNGVWNNVDFGKMQFIIIFDFDSDGVLSIYPQTNSNRAILSGAAKQNMYRALYSNTSGVSLSSNIKLNGVNVGENGLRIVDNANLECQITAANETESKQKLSVILATYTNDGSLYQVKTADIEIDENSIGSAEIVYKFNAEQESAGKLMFWNSVSGMIPIKTTVDFSQSSGINAYYYNADNRLLQIDKANNTSIYFTYDNMGNLLTRTTEGLE